MLKPYKDPYGYKKLLAYKKAEELQLECNKLTQLFPGTKTMYDLADQMNRSARSGKQNIVEGWRRNTTKEYYDFLGFCIGAIAELEEDCNDVWKGVYKDLMGIKGIMGEMGGRGIERDEMGEKGERGEGERRIMGERGIKKDITGEMGEGERGIMEGMGIESDAMRKNVERGIGRDAMGIMGENERRIVEERGNYQNSSSNPINPLNPFPPFDIEKLKFYPLDESLPPIVKLKLRCKELNFMLHRLQESLLIKMEQERTLPTRDKIRLNNNKQRSSDDIERNILEQYGFEKLENGQVIKKKM